MEPEENESAQAVESDKRPISAEDIYLWRLKTIQENATDIKRMSIHLELVTGCKNSDKIDTPAMRVKEITRLWMNAREILDLAESLLEDEAR